MTKKPQKDDDQHPDAMERMNRALKEALRTPPRPHKDEPKRGKGAVKKGKGK
ncbi:MAG: hypothetical protein AB7O43_10010 [Hyphomicrobiaceae bacterium]